MGKEINLEKKRECKICHCLLSDKESGPYCKSCIFDIDEAKLDEYDEW